MRMYDIIYKKRTGKKLSDDEIRFAVAGYTDGTVPDYQMSALAMAICINGMDGEEAAVLTDAMMHSGDTADLSALGSLSVDKHSTGGVGDKTTLIVAPIVAALGSKVAKMSGRGLGHTGGTIDKLESIDGYRTTLDESEFISIAKKVGVSVIGQSGSLAPADKKLYALRDVTATVDSTVLIASSIMSKKLACGAKSIVLDVKCGSGAFMKTEHEATELAEMMIGIGRHCGRNVSALITDMDIPLGHAIGNSLEVEEAVSVLKGENIPDLREICTELAAHMISLSQERPLDNCRRDVIRVIDDGSAFEKMKEWVSAQGGDTHTLENMPRAKFCHRIISDRNGYIYRMNTEGIGIAASVLGAGRITKEDKIDLTAGIILHYKTGDYIRCGEPVATLYSSTPSRFQDAERQFISSIVLSESKPDKRPLVISSIE